jgi:hypothetical protein
MKSKTTKLLKKSQKKKSKIKIIKTELQTIIHDNNLRMKLKTSNIFLKKPRNKIRNKKPKH